KMKVFKELNSGREINALFLIHGYIEAYLTDWLFVQGKRMKSELSKKIVDEVTRIGFRTLTNIHLLLGNIDEALYCKLNLINKARNEIAHTLTTIDISGPTIKQQIKKSVQTAISICDEISAKYQERLGERAKELLLNCPKCGKKLIPYNEIQCIDTDIAHIQTWLRCNCGFSQALQNDLEYTL
ncbi:hypothetical protein KKB40_01645, partial [Patescibacteria group bacterium]|nr:hypothetical protein [Patescibacteria group bacterium]